MSGSARSHPSLECGQLISGCFTREVTCPSPEPLTAHSSSVSSPLWVMKWWQVPSFTSNQGYGEFMSSIIWHVQKTLHIAAPWTLTSVTFCCLLWDVPSSSTPLSSPRWNFHPHTPELALPWHDPSPDPYAEGCLIFLCITSDKQIPDVL